LAGSSVTDWPVPPSQVSKKYVSKELAKEIHAKAAPFVKWLKEAEVESGASEEEEDDENVEVTLNMKCVSSDLNSHLARCRGDCSETRRKV